MSRSRFHKFDGAKGHFVVAAAADDFEAAFFGCGARDVPFAGEGAIVVRVFEKVAEGLAFVFGFDRSAVARGAVLMGIEARHIAGALGSAQGMRAIGASEAHAGFGEAVHIWGVYVGVVRTGHGPGVLLIGNDEEDIGTIWHETSFFESEP